MGSIAMKFATSEQSIRRLKAGINKVTRPMQQLCVNADPDLCCISKSMQMHSFCQRIDLVADAPQHTIFTALLSGCARAIFPHVSRATLFACVSCSGMRESSLLIWGRRPYGARSSSAEMHFCNALESALSPVLCAPTAASVVTDESANISFDSADFPLQ